MLLKFVVFVCRGVIIAFVWISTNSLILILHFSFIHSFIHDMLTRALCPVHIPDKVRTAARIISGLPVSIMLSSRGTPLFWKILSAPASSLDSTIRLLAA